MPQRVTAACSFQLLSAPVALLCQRPSGVLTQAKTAILTLVQYLEARPTMWCSLVLGSFLVKLRDCRI